MSTLYAILLATRAMVISHWLLRAAQCLDIQRIGCNLRFFDVFIDFLEIKQAKDLENL